jgi:4-hydroxy-tetrahydrodipicolinate synthase
MTPFAGLLAYILTPTTSGAVDADAFAARVARLAAHRPHAIGVMGSTGGYLYLAPDQRRRAVAAACEAAGGVPVVAGVGALTTAEALAHAEHAARAGAAGLLLPAPSYLPLTEAEVTALAREVADATDLPVCLYDNPGTTGFAFSERLISELSAHPRITAVKNPAPRDGDHAAPLGRLRAACGPGFSVGWSGDAAAAGAMAAGADAFHSVLGGIAPGLMLALWEARADPARLAAITAALAPLHRLFDAHGSIRIAYALSDVMGGRVVPPRPLLPLPAPVEAEARAALDAARAALAA